MSTFLDRDFLLQSEPARALYHEYAEPMPILDYHCHISPREIAEDKRYDSITELWLGGDHYKWRVMRACGIPEQEITGAIEKDPYGVFAKWIKSLNRAIGNPLYHWSYLELKRYFGIDERVTEENVRRIYDRCNARLQDPEMSVRGIILQSNVKLICTTDDPVADLGWHRQIAKDPGFPVKVIPAFRPDQALHIEKPEFSNYIQQLSAVSNIAITRFADVIRALETRMDYFATMGGCISDHALDCPVFVPVSNEETLDRILQKALMNQLISPTECAQYMTAVILALASAYHKRDWVMQIHFGCIRNNSSRSYAQLGPDTGFDCMGNSQGARELAMLLDTMEQNNDLPNMVLYSLNPSDNEVITSIAGCFQRDSGSVGRIQLGSAWWFNDHESGMRKQLTDFATGGVLGNFIGMLTDSRSFLSYTRHEYFRRILCDLIGDWADKGKVHLDLPYLGKMIQDISYNNAIKFFKFEKVGLTYEYAEL